MAIQTKKLRWISLFTGGGGGELAMQHLIGGETVCYVEWNRFAARVLEARIGDGVLHDAPIWSDVNTFDAVPWRGIANALSAGFPCQPFSSAGKREAGYSHKNQWPATIDIIRVLRPRIVWLENVSGLLAGSHGYFGVVLGELAQAGYDARWTCLSAEDCGAPHRRERLWVYAELSNTDRVKRKSRAHEEWGAATEKLSKAELRDAYRESEPIITEHAEGSPGLSRDAADAPGWWEAEPRLDRVADGVADQMDRLRALGNGQVPRVAYEAWRLLSEQ